MVAVFVAVRPRLSVTLTVIVAVPLTVSSPLVKSTLAEFTVFLYASAVYPLMLVSIFDTVLLSTPLPVVWMRTAHFFCTYTFPTFAYVVPLTVRIMLVVIVPMLGTALLRTLYVSPVMVYSPIFVLPL